MSARSLRRRRTWLVATLWCATLLALPATAGAYLHFGITLRGQSVDIKWSRTPIRWYATNRGVPNVTAAQFQATVARAFATWQAVPTAALAFEFGGFTGADPFEDDSLSVIGFQNEPDLERVLGATGFVIDTLTGEIVESDIFINSTFPWTTTGADPLRYDLESVALHEIGHFLGLGHSALGETERRPDGTRRVLGSSAVMFPISLGRGTTQDRVLQPDDIAGVSDLYPGASFRADTGSARGTVVRNGSGVFGAHVTVFNLATGLLVGSFALDRNGEFEVAGLAPGTYVVRAEPLDDAEIGSFFEASDPVRIDFAPTYYERVLVVPRGGAGERIVIPARAR